jgi:hypothetical protein
MTTTHTRQFGQIPVNSIFTPAPPSSDSDSDSSDGSYTSEEYQLGLQYFNSSPDRYSDYPYNSDATARPSPPTLAIIESLNSGTLSEEQVDEEVELLVMSIESDERLYNPPGSRVDIRVAMADGRLSDDSDPFEIYSESLQLQVEAEFRTRAWVEGNNNQDGLDEWIMPKIKIAPKCGLRCAKDRNVFVDIPDHNWNYSNGPAIRKQQHAAGLGRLDYLDLAVPAAQPCVDCADRTDRAAVRVQADHVRFDHIEVEQVDQSMVWWEEMPPI